MLKLPHSFEVDALQLRGELLMPAGAGPRPAVLLIGGTLCDTRDGDLEAAAKGDAPSHGLLRVMAESLAEAGLATLRWDKRGIGASEGASREWNADLWTDTRDALAALRSLVARPDIDARRVFVLGESAGAHHACLLAPDAPPVAGWILQGALFDDLPTLLEFNFERVRRYAAAAPEQRLWVEQHAPRALWTGEHWREMVAAAQRGEEAYEAQGAPGAQRRSIRRLNQELQWPPAVQFSKLSGPTLVIQGCCDMNVPPNNGPRLAAHLRSLGCCNVTLQMIPGADHSMQAVPDDDEQRLLERVSLASFSNCFVAEYFTAMNRWFEERLS